MPTLSLAGKQFRRYPDPPVRRVNPNGTQEYTAYQALFTYYDPRPDDPALAGYYVGLSGLLSTQNILSYLLFGSDYPAIVNITSVYPSGGYFDDGSVNRFKNMTFNESATGIGGSTNFNTLLSNATTYFGQEGYKRIITGPTVTNGVSVSGFPEFRLLSDHSIYVSDPSAGGDLPPQPDLFLHADVVLNAATVHSTSPYFGFELDAEGGLVAEQIRQPVILWEPSLTQQILDDGYTITVSNQLCGPTIFDVVGIWSIPGYSPLYVPPALGLARSFAAPSSGLSSADESLLASAVAGLSAASGALKRRK